MKQLNFKVTFLSDVVLQASSNNVGKIDILDFIPGSVFLGIVAKNYKNFDNSFDIFHGGKVRFGEATPFLNKKQTYKMPLSFYSPKLDFDNKENYNNHFVDYTDDEILALQLKQKKEGYINSDFAYATIDHSYSQKSAYDKKLRRSKDEQMFGYKSLKKGLTWLFSLKYDDSVDIEKIVECLVGIRYLGKSKTSQYGKVKIEKLENFNTNMIEENDLSEITYVYINSSLALFDEAGNYTLTPTRENLGLKDGDIEWSKTQLKTKTYTPYNYKREGFDSSRLLIQKGSIIAIRNASSEDIKILKSGIGAFLSEGYGEVLINPKFLLKKGSFLLNKIDLDKEFEVIKDNQKDENLLAFLNQKNAEKKEIYNYALKVETFIKSNHKKFEKVSKSQWGQIRMIVQFNQDGDYIEKIEEFINKGKSKNAWEKCEKLLLDTLKDENLEFAKLLTIMMPKYKGE